MNPQLHGKTRCWHDEQGRLHRTSGPAIEYASGFKEWHHHGRLTRREIRLSATNDEHGCHARRIEVLERPGQVSQRRGPAVEESDGTRSWWRHGKMLRVDHVRERPSMLEREVVP